MITKIKKVSLHKPILIACWPGMGEVAFRSGLFLKDSLGFKKFAVITDSGLFPAQAVVVSAGILSMPQIEEGSFYFHKGQGASPDIILFLGQAQPPFEKVNQFAELILEFVLEFNVSRVFTFAAFPQAIEHRQPSSVLISATDKAVLNEFSKYKLKVLKEGQITGLNGLLLGAAKARSIPGVCLLGEIPFYTIQVENPKATLAILGILADYLKLTFDSSLLKKRATVLENEIDKLISYLKGEASEQEDLPLSEDDILKIRKDLEKFTKLPQSARHKIDSLFKKASFDISFASELKKMLDEWGVYKEYEDRFLDLFKKKRLDH